MQILLLGLMKLSLSYGPFIFRESVLACLPHSVISVSKDGVPPS